MTEPDQYLRGYSEAEQDRYERQALELADDSARQVGLASGQSVVEIGCGPRGCSEPNKATGLDGALKHSGPNPTVGRSCTTPGARRKPPAAKV